jgi:hypothetical protein
MSELFNCLEATRLISKGQHVELSLADTTVLNMHMAMCNCCQGFKKDLDFVKEKLSQINQGQNYNLDPLVKEDLNQKVLIELNK